ncbi:dTDP-glucose 4,6-dehydratase [Euzebya tangerina]|uniref:dTDP-glucose 4,6-dehydratase n=1 Tax=Euzebya tangerina TaxID=591198 RepID=UPI000E30C3CB|nr:dTDP-glucose 4,6-dehydratase [Euzebya tangerina]
MRIFVTGGAGFIGSNFIRYALSQDADVRITNFDKLTYAGNPANLADIEADPTTADRYTFLKGDICDHDHVTEAMAGHDAIVNFAAESHVDRSITGGAEFLVNNVIGAQIVFDTARHLGIERTLHISTDEVYGSIEEPDSFVEGDALEPNSPYSVSKASADLLARSYGVTYDFPITVTRTANNFGPFHYPEKVIPLFVTNLIDGRPVPLYGEGSNVRDWTYVIDNAAAQWLVLTQGTPGEVYNVGAGNELTNKALTYAILDRFDLRDEDAEAMIQHVADRPGHDLRYSVDTAKVRALGWEPAHSFTDALDATVEWYRANEAWWRPLKDSGASDRRGLVDAGSTGT